MMRKAENMSVYFNDDMKRKGMEVTYVVWFTSPELMASAKSDDYEDAESYGLAAVQKYALPDYMAPAYAVYIFRKSIRKDFERYKAIMAAKKESAE